MYLLDTNVVAEITKPAPAPQVIAWLAANESEVCLLSVLTIGEIQQGVSRLGPSKRRSRLAKWLET